MCSSRVARVLVSLACVMLWSQHAYATARFIQGVFATAGTGNTSCTVAATQSGTTILVMFASNGTETVSSISDTNADTFTVVNTLYTQSTNQKGGYATAVATSGNTTITVTWSGSSNTHYTTCAEVIGTASCTAGACVDIAQGLGCASALSCGPTTGQAASQNDEILFSAVFTNTAVTIQTSTDASNCRASSTCGGNTWAALTANNSAYYRAIYSGGSPTCTWSWLTSSIAGVECVSLKSANSTTATFVQGTIAPQSTGSNTCTFPGGTTVSGSLLVALFEVSNATDTVSSVTDTSGDTFTVVNTIYTSGSSSSGGFATAISGGTGNTVLTINWSGSGNHNAQCAEVINVGTCALGACVDSQIRVGTGCTSACINLGPTSSKTADQNDEIIFSGLMNNGNATINTQTSADSGVCDSSATTTGTCSVTKWNSTGSASTIHSSAYYRNIASGGAQTCSTSWTGSVISGMTCVGIRSNFAGASATCTMGLLGVGCEDNLHDVVEEHR